MLFLFSAARLFSAQPWILPGESLALYRTSVFFSAVRGWSHRNCRKSSRSAEYVSCQADNLNLTAWWGCRAGAFSSTLGALLISFGNHFRDLIEKSPC